MLLKQSMEKSLAVFLILLFIQEINFGLNPVNVLIN